MKYGAMIKNARKKMDLIQADLSNNNLSRAIVSDIEKGKTRLVPSKGLLIYEYLVIQSIDKKIDIELNFDNLLKDNYRYNQLKTAREIVTQLNTSIDGKISISQRQIEQFRLFALRNDVGLLKYFIFQYIALQLCIPEEYKLKVLCNALDYLKWQPFDKIHKYYDNTLNDLTPLGFKHAKFDQLLQYYKYFEEGYLDFGLQLEARIYYNIGLLYKQLKDFKLAHKYIERYLDFSRNIPLTKRLNGLIILGNISTLSKDYENALVDYKKVYNLSNSKETQMQRMTVCNSLLYNMIRVKTDNLDLLQKYLNEYLELYPNFLHELYQKHSAYLNVALTFDYLGKTAQAISNLDSAIKTSHSESAKVTVISEAFHLMSAVSTTWILDNIAMIDYHSLSEYDKNKITSILLIILTSNSDLTETKIFIQNKLDKIINHTDLA